MDKEKNVSVCMAVYNGEKYLREAIDSILNQTYPYFELIIINDGSTDNSENLILSYTDKRIRYLKNDTNKGLIYTRNRALAEVNTKYTAILDCDDVSLPERLEKQINFLEKNTDVAVCGTWGLMINEESKIFGHKIMPEFNPKTVNVEMLFRNQFIHSSVMYQTKIAKDNGGYQAVNGCEDYGLFAKISMTNKLANIPEFLTYYREHEKGISKTNTKEINVGEIEILKSLYDRFNCPEEYLDIPKSIIANKISQIDSKIVNPFFTHLLKVNNEAKYYNIKDFKSVIFKHWYTIILNNKQIDNILLFYKNAKSENFKLSFKQKKKLIKLKVSSLF